MSAVPRQQVAPVTAANSCPMFGGVWECSTRVDGNVKACLNRPVHVPTFLDRGLCNPSFVESQPCNCSTGPMASVATRGGSIPKPADPSASLAVFAPLVEASKAAVQQRIAARPAPVPKAKEAFGEDGVYFEEDDDAY